ncbi:CotO family spore coat protein [Salimicrobium halophilum]|uniref:Spore coat protein CotO n=1 Tax=Salimicrobium halophilum TaxID=86666 RepID=A0A1G8TUE0_9BACI|nr:CotO family spore coat protein [Salimicrobium halophilum]SDJ45122.1 Spore coat protein CotO [Salimicrobium halophilum]
MKQEGTYITRPKLYITQPPLPSIEKKGQETYRSSPEVKKEESGNDHAPGERRRRFQDMELEEKVNYFVTLPSQMPKMKCVVETKEKEIQGYVMSYDGTDVGMKTFRRPYHETVPFEEITSIRLLGF